MINISTSCVRSFARRMDSSCYFDRLDLQQNILVGRTRGLSRHRVSESIEKCYR